MRIVGGKKRGVRLFVPKGTLTRPTLDSTRESLMNILENGRFKGCLRQTYIADVFAGSGAVGLEMLSRGAKHCDFYEKNIQAVTTLKRNIQKVNAGIDIGTYTIFYNALKPTSTLPYDIIFMDAPYGQGLNHQACQAFLKMNLITTTTLLVLQMDKRTNR